MRKIHENLTKLGCVLLLISSLHCHRSFACENKFETGNNKNGTLPNIVLILSDDQAWTDYGFMGHPVIQTPRLDELAARSAFFPRGYIPTSLCRPSLATIVSGLYAHQHRIIGNDPSPAGIDPQSPQYAEMRESMIARFDHVPTLPKILANEATLVFNRGNGGRDPIVEVALHTA